MDDEEIQCCCLGRLPLSVLAIPLRKITFALVIVIIKYSEKLGISIRTEKKDTFVYLVNK